MVVARALSMDGKAGQNGRNALRAVIKEFNSELVYVIHHLGIIHAGQMMALMTKRQSCVALVYA